VEERRLVTVLFCDIVGSTALAGDVDAEDWAEIVRAVFPLMIDPVERYGGTVARLMGDAILAFFGAPTAREDDPQRAILAALEIESGITGNRERLRAEYGFEIDVRVGINTGIVVTGEFGSHAAREYTAMGDAVNIAARMEQSAEPGTIQISAETYRLALPFFEFQPLGVIEVKGKAEGVDAYRVLGRISGPGRQRGLQDFAVPLVGRDRELDLLRYRLRELDAGHGGVIAITAEAGLGKSRLIQELHQHWLGQPEHDDGSWVEDQLVSFEETTPYGLVHRRLARDLDMRDGVPRSVSDDRLNSVVSALGPRDRNRAIQAVGHLFNSAGHPDEPSSAGMGIDDAEDFRYELGLVFEHTWRVRIERLGSCVYVIEDFHCIDASSADLLERLVPDLLDLPLLIVLTFRPERESPSWKVHERLSASLGIQYLSLSLVPLVQQDSGSLIDALLPGAAIPAALRQMMLERIDGNPLFAEEMIRSLIEHGFVRPAADGLDGDWRISPDVDLAAVEIPTTLQALIQERVDMLDAGAKRTLQFAAVIGRTFEYDELLEIIGDPAALDTHLMTLHSAMLVRPDTYAGAGNYAFQHALIWEAVYRSMLRRTLQRLHLHVGEALERLYVGEREEYAVQLAQHFAVARDARAIAYAEIAGVHAQALFAPQEAIEHFTRALKAADDLGQIPSVRLLRQRGRAYETRGSFDEARRDFDVALELARTSDDLREEWETLVEIGRSWEGVDYDQSGTWFEQALELARRLDDPVALGRSLNRVGTWYTNTERIDEARAVHLEALTIFEDLDDEVGVAATIDYLGVVADLAGDLVEMRDRYERAVEIFERRGDLRSLSSTLASMTSLSGAWVFEVISSVSALSFGEAESHGLRAEQLAREIGWRAGEAYAMLNLSSLYLSNARYDKAFRYTYDAMEVSQSIAHSEWLCGSYAALGSLFGEVLALDRAIAPFEESIRLAHESGSKHFIHVISGLFVDILVGAGQLDRAGDILTAVAHDLPMITVGQRRIWVAHANWSLATGDSAAALKKLDLLLESGLNVESQTDIPLIAWRRGLALAELGRTIKAVEALLAAEQGARRLQWSGRRWKIQLDLARLYHSLGRDDEASEELFAAREIVQQIAPRIPDDDLRQNFLAISGAMFDAVM
jgi:class 3 adenylate cyclase/tetratricopeptide (TPR) repeat protein